MPRLISTQTLSRPHLSAARFILSSRPSAHGTRNMSSRYVWGQSQRPEGPHQSFLRRGGSRGRYSTGRGRNGSYLGREDRPGPTLRKAQWNEHGELLTPGGVPVSLNRRQEDAVNAAMVDYGLYETMPGAAPTDNPILEEDEAPDAITDQVHLANIPETATILEMRNAVLDRLALLNQRLHTPKTSKSKNARKKIRHQAREKQELERIMEALNITEAERSQANNQNTMVQLKELREKFGREYRAPAVQSFDPLTTSTANSMAGYGEIDPFHSGESLDIHGLANLPPNNYLRLTANRLIAERDPYYRPPQPTNYFDYSQFAPTESGAMTPRDHYIPQTIPLTPRDQLLPDLNTTISENQSQVRPTRERHRDPISRPSPESGGVPEPTPAYLKVMRSPSRQTLWIQPLLLVLDLNGTLVYRPNKGAPGKFIARPMTEQFLEYALENFQVMLWSSARSKNVDAICSKLLPSHLRSRLVAEWGREHFGLTPQDYNKRVQVYKRLTYVWQNRIIQASHPFHTYAWDQTNTVLIDDSAEKGRSEPGNVLVVPEFLGQEEEDCVLAKLMDYLEILKFQQNVSSFIYRNPFNNPLPSFQRQFPPGWEPPSTNTSNERADSSRQQAAEEQWRREDIEWDNR